MPDPGQGGANGLTVGPSERGPRSRRSGQRGDNRGDSAHSQPAPIPNGLPNAPVSSEPGGGERKPRRRNNNRGHGQQKLNDAAPDNFAGAQTSGRDPLPHQQQHQQQQARSRRDQFSGKLTADINGNAAQKAAPMPSQAYIPQPNPQATDLTNRLVHALSTPPYTDCAICFNAIHPAQPTWSCSPSSEATACCWTSFHLKCIRAWAIKSTKETRAAFQARGEDSEGEWRCPGCQTKRHAVPHSYLCFCGQVNDPKPARLSTPHSCGNACTRKRLACEHACPLPCHPGPCPPCITTVTKPCFCNRTNISFRCAHLSTVPAPPMSCGSPCNKMLTCGKHRCVNECHVGSCKPCPGLDFVQCYCGKERKQISCGEGEAKICTVGEGANAIQWTGRFECESDCERPFLCGIHKCMKKCHPPSPLPLPCPKDPSLVTHCPCGKTKLGAMREKCTDPIPTCESTCAKDLTSCKHACASRCHLGDCPPCGIPVAIPCRCGETTRYIPCFEHQRNVNQGTEVLCDKVCKNLRLCGRHECTRPCCPAHNLRPKAGKGKKKAQNLSSATAYDDPLESMETAWHTCEFLCGKPLTCGLHSCDESDHRGPCPPCLRSSFEELVCKCGRTVMQPPIPCGTKIACTYPCAEPPPTCGHPKTPHPCHESGTCPSCPFLTSKACACGKQNISNVRCSQEKVSCGKPCGKPMPCGYHVCERVCHGDDCGDCHAVCGKPRKFCLPQRHPCTSPCHAPSACDETEPCQERVRATCECGRIQQPALCGRSSSNATARDSQKLECSQDCQVAKRNARLAEALGISPRTTERQTVVYTPELVQFAKGNARFVALVEKTLAEFVTSDKRSQVLPEMPESRRAFVTSLAAIYRMDTALVDVEPHQSVQITRRIDTRIPSPVLSQAAGPSTPTSPALGRLVNLQAPARPIVTVTPPKSKPASPAPRPGSGWASVVASAAAPAAPTPAAPVSRLTALPRSSSTPASIPRRSPAATTSSWEDDV
ncbi:hypothetical protein BKA62DRAFT_643194 [Auriculariales sp. MPI-PUGE-AT-0066]|nr:hypothetical protein BKA62DRAFT_643194 [Auriculariales sp. MPI-PUGE-AT-0066]